MKNTTTTTNTTNSTVANTTAAASVRANYENNYNAVYSGYNSLANGEITHEKFGELFAELLPSANRYSDLRGLEKLANVETLYSFGYKNVQDEADKVTREYTRKRLSRALEESDFTSREAWNAHVAACERVFFSLAEWHGALKADANPNARLFRNIKQETQKAVVALRDAMGASGFIRVNSAVTNAFVALCTKQKRAVGVVKTVALRSKAEVRAAVEDLVRAAINGVELSVIVAAKKEELTQYKQAKKEEEAAEKAAKEAAKKAEKPAAEKKAVKAENKTDKAAVTTAA